MNRQATIGKWTRGLGQLLFVVVMLVCGVDLLGVTERGGLAVPLAAYLIGIFSGVLMQFLGAAIPNMRFANVYYVDKPAK